MYKRITRNFQDQEVLAMAIPMLESSKTMLMVSILRLFLLDIPAPWPRNLPLQNSLFRLLCSLLLLLRHPFSSFPALQGIWTTLASCSFCSLFFGLCFMCLSGVKTDIRRCHKFESMARLVMLRQACYEYRVGLERFNGQASSKENSPIRENFLRKAGNGILAISTKAETNT